MKGNVIKIYDTSTGALIVPYHLSNTNLIFLCSNVNGSLAFIDIAGKLTLINVFTKSLVFETNSVLTLIEALTSQNPGRSFSLTSLHCGSSMAKLDETFLYIIIQEIQALSEDGVDTQKVTKELLYVYN